MGDGDRRHAALSGRAAGRLVTGLIANCEVAVVVLGIVVVVVSVVVVVVLVVVVVVSLVVSVIAVVVCACLLTPLSA